MVEDSNEDQVVVVPRFRKSGQTAALYAMLAVAAAAGVTPTDVFLEPEDDTPPEEPVRIIADSPTLSYEFRALPVTPLGTPSTTTNRAQKRAAAVRARQADKRKKAINRKRRQCHDRS